jgi:hypothetical protein
LSKYEIVFKNKKAQKGWDQIRQRDAAGLQRCWDWLSETPLQRHPGGKTLIFRSQRKRGVIEFRVNYHDRVFYTVDKEANLVIIEHAGPHPKY